MDWSREVYGYSVMLFLFYFVLRYLMKGFVESLDRLASRVERLYVLNLHMFSRILGEDIEVLRGRVERFMEGYDAGDREV